jgi:hypothetical protein
MMTQQSILLVNLPWIVVTIAKKKNTCWNSAMLLCDLVKHLQQVEHHLNCRRQKHPQQASGT